MDISPIDRKDHFFDRYLLIVFIALATIIILIGFLYYQKQRKELYRLSENQLKAISALKIRQIEWWLHERIGDASVLMQNAPVIATIQKYFVEKSDREKAWLLQWLKEYKKQYAYPSIALFDQNLALQIADGEAFDITDKQTLAYIRTSLENKDVVMTDIHLHGPDAVAHMGTFIPLFLQADGGAALVGLFMLVIDPSQYLFPLMQEWPTPSPTAETLLVRMEGEDVAFINELRHRKNTPLNFRLPIARSDLPATMAVQGKIGIVKGKDYRGVAVLADIRPVPNTNWFIVCKQDISEIERPLETQALLSLIAMLSIIAAAGGFMGFLGRRETARFYRSRYEAERERTQMLEALQEKDRRIRTYFEESLIGMAIISPDKKWLQVNKKLCDMLKYSPEELEGAAWEKLTHPDDLEIDNEKFRQLISGKTDGYVLDRRFIRKDGGLLYAILSIKAIRGDEGVDYCVAQLADVTAQKKAMMERIQLDKLSSMGLLVAGIVHELNNPLMGIINYAQAGLDSKSRPDKIENNLKCIERETRRCIKIVESLLIFAHAGPLNKDRFQPANPLTPVNRALDLMSFRIRKDDIAVHVATPPDLSNVCMIEDKFQQVILNLVSNAIDAIEGSARREIFIRLEAQGKWLIWSIRDTGCGIPEEHMDKIFDPFFTTKPVGKGTGLGLSTCWAVVKEHRGEISFESQPGEGTTVVVKIPVMCYEAE